MSVKIGSGLHAPARFFFTLLVGLLASPLTAQTPRRPPAPAPAATPSVDIQTVNKLVWSTLAAVDHGNVTGNYSVLRDLGAPGFQANNNAATLAGVFQTVRTQRIDLSNTLLLSPTYDFAPTIVQGGLLRARGRFAIRPTAIGFDLLFANVAGRWQLFGVAVVPLPMAAGQPTQRR
ncbi:MAG: hypothetical protein AVDCRST_MAG91-1217 [uncultured Sphingomonadaceae bacterium]|uniref:Uncharacterized protein n=1 Tax=uncultured Sphingomonadaceae bacterium TaxID=169976 RepID=A0A6J4SS39_9SPHN|nr:MAG: hypothetical protein AVDCRST_MAG91-1217 [uncultured Sphingomonadaceae bacterium]